MLRCLLFTALTDLAFSARTRIHTHSGHQISKDFKDFKCAKLDELKCAESVEYAVSFGWNESWAPYAYANVHGIAGMHYLNATADDFQRAYWCGGIPNVPHCAAPPCQCTNPPCNTCGSFRFQPRKLYRKHAGKRCFLKHGATPLKEDFDEELPGWLSEKECRQACDASFKCKAFTRGIGSSSACWLREHVKLGDCKDDSNYVTMVRKKDPQCAKVKCTEYDYDKTCAKFDQLTCGQSVAWNFYSGTNQTWADTAYEPMSKISGIDWRSATIDDFHRMQYCGALAASDDCELPPCECSKPPCDQCGGFEREGPLPKGPAEYNVYPAQKGKPMGYEMQDSWVGQNWCKAQPPVPEWSVHQGCSAEMSTTVEVLTYNLYWWQLFDERGGAHRSAGRLVERSGPFDFMGFQECDNVTRIVEDSSALHSHGMYAGTAALSVAWHKGKWSILETGFKLLAEDHQSQWYGKRGVVFARALHKKTGKVVFFMNYHGTLPVKSKHTGGKCGEESIAYNILRVIGENAHKGDAVILVGDFNSERNSKLLTTLGKHLVHQYQGHKYNGVDNIFSNQCAQLTHKKNLGGGGSDHDALSASFRI